MPNQTKNYSLIKPLKDENYNIEVSNQNMDIIDTKLKEVSSKANEQDITGNSATATALKNSRKIGVLTGDITSAGSNFDGTADNSNASIISNNAVTNSKLAKMPTMTVKGNNTLDTADSKDLTKTEIQELIQDTTHRMVTDTQIAAWTAGASNFDETVVNGITPASVTIPSNLPVGYEKVIRKIGVTGAVSIQFTDSNEKFTPALLTSLQLNYSGDSYKIKKITSTMWVIIENTVKRTSQNLTASRVKDQLYTNTTGQDIEVIVVGYNSGTNLTLNLKRDGAYIDNLVIQGTGIVASIKATIPNGSTYSAEISGSTGTPTISRWTELRN